MSHMNNYKKIVQTSSPSRFRLDQFLVDFHKVVIVLLVCGGLFRQMVMANLNIFELLLHD